MDDKGNLIADEIRKLMQLEPPAWCRVASAVERFVIRGLRVTGGIALVGIAIWLFRIAVETLQEPFASLTPLALLGGIAAGLGGLVLLVAAFGVAFGEKRESRVEAAWRRHRAESRVLEVKRRLLGYED